MIFNDRKEVASELLPFLRVYKCGMVERFHQPTYAPPSPGATKSTAVLSKDTNISQDVSARLYLPNPSQLELKNNMKLPVLVYFHGGGFCIESAFSVLCHRYVTTIASLANAIVVSVEYRLAPEHPLPTAYEDSWTALQWVASHSTKETIEKDPWLARHGNFNRLYIGGDSAGANICHNIAMRAGIEKLSGGIEIYGAFLSQPYFLGSEPLGSEPKDGHETSLLQKTWFVAYPGAVDGIDNPMINPFAKNAPPLSRLGCRKLFVCVASNDELRDRGIRYCDAVRESGWEGESVEVFEVEGEGHGFHIFNPETENAKEMFKRLAGFVAH